MNKTLDVNCQHMNNVHKEVMKRDTQIDELTLSNIEFEQRIQNIERERDVLIVELG